MRNVFLMLATLISVLGSSDNAFSDPVVTNVTGNFYNNSSAIISGTGFTSHANYGGTKGYLNAAWDNFESGAISTSLWSWDSPYTGRSIVASPVRTNSTHTVRQQRGSGQYGSIGLSGDTSQRYVYIYCWRYVGSFTQPFPSYAGGTAKFFRIYSSDVSNDWVLALNNDNPGNFVWLMEASSPERGGSYGTDLRNSWHNFEIIVDGNAGNWYAYIDGKLASSQTGQGTAGWNPGRIYFDSFTNAENNPGYTYTDDAFVDYTQARVMLCPGSTWANRGACEIQVPMTWTISSINVQFNQGRFANGNTAYLYVVDSTGANSQGYSVTIGQSGTNKIPTSPSGFSIP